MKNYHDDDQILSWDHHWGCPLIGGFFIPGSSSGVDVPSLRGVFNDWKISGVGYNDYANFRVGSPITTHYHWWDTGTIIGMVLL